MSQATCGDDDQEGCHIMRFYCKHKKKLLNIAPTYSKRACQHRLLYCNQVRAAATRDYAYSFQEVI